MGAIPCGITPGRDSRSKRTAFVHRGPWTVGSWCSCTANRNPCVDITRLFGSTAFRSFSKCRGSRGASKKMCALSIAIGRVEEHPLLLQHARVCIRSATEMTTSLATLADFGLMARIHDAHVCHAWELVAVAASHSSRGCGYSCRSCSADQVSTNEKKSIIISRQGRCWHSLIFNAATQFSKALKSTCRT